MEKNAERWLELCELAAKETEPNKLIALTNEIARLLDEKKKSRSMPEIQTAGSASVGCCATTEA